MIRTRRCAPQASLRRCAFLGASLGLLTLVPARAATITVTTTADLWDLPGNAAPCSLREAISSMNDAVNAGGCVKTGDAYGVNDRIELGATTYALTLAGAGEDGNATGDFDVGVFDTPAARNVTIAGTGSASTILDGGDLDRLFHVLELATLRLEDLTVQNGTANFGGGIFVADQGELTVERVVVADNVALGTEPSVGGGIQAHGSLTLIDTTVRDNVADLNDRNGGKGGGIASSGSLHITGSTISGNRVKHGGHFVWGWGGGLRLCQRPAVTADKVITNSTISGNFSFQNGGGISLADGCHAGEAPTEPSIVTEAAIVAGQLVLNNVTITGNFTDSYQDSAGGGVWTEAAMTLRNTVIAHNHALRGDDCVASSAGLVTSAGYNFVGEADVETGQFTCLDGSGTGDIVGSAALPGDAELRILAYQGGETETHGLGPVSPLRDAGDPDGCEDEAAAVLDVDQRGEPRPVGTRCDIGAFEGPPFFPALDFYTLDPCRLFDSRSVPPPLAHGAERDIAVNGICGVPAAAAVASLNLTAVQATGPGGIDTYPQDGPQSPESKLRFLALQARANNDLVALAGSGLSALATFIGGAGSVELIVDVNGYFEVNAPPDAVNDQFSIPKDSGATAFDVLANDTDAEGDAKLIVAVSQPAHGAVTITGGGTGLTYTPDGGYCSLNNSFQQQSPDAFAYELSPGGATAVVTVELTCSECFAAGTLVWTESGQRPIEDILPGERVWALDQATGEARLAPVEWVTSRTVPALLAIDVGGEVLRTTAEHPFWTGAGWTPAHALLAGHVLTTLDGTALAIRRIDALPGAATVYNLHVGGLHTFFVGPSGVLVHNK